MSIYYAAKGLRGKPYHSDIINKDLFAFFQKRASNYYFPSDEALRAADAFSKCDMDLIRYTDADYEYACEEGTFYIPKSICVGEIIEPGKVFDYYYVVLCGDEVELRHLYRDRPTRQDLLVGRDTEVTDPDIIAKIERTLAVLMKVNEPKVAEPVYISRQTLLRFLTLLGVTDAEGLADKIHAAATKPTECAALCEEFDYHHFEIYTGWHLELMQLALRDRERLDWVDWKEAPAEVFASLCSLLPPGAKEHLPPWDDEEVYSEYAYPDEVLRDCSPVLHDRYGLTILLWDEDADEYKFMVVPNDKVEEAFALASELGITLQRLEDLPRETTIKIEFF